MRDEPLAEHGDRALGGRVEVGERAPLRARADRAVQLDAMRLAQLGGRRAARSSSPSAVKNSARPGELAQLHGGDRAAPRRAARSRRSASRSPRARHPLDDREVEPLDVADDRDARPPALTAPASRRGGAASRRVRGSPGSARQAAPRSAASGP